VNIYHTVIWAAVKSEVFDHFLGVKFGQFKRYGMEGTTYAVRVLIVLSYLLIVYVPCTAYRI